MERICISSGNPAVISYLEIRRKNFYRIENTVDGKVFATARGWEDLSQLIQVYEMLEKTVDRDVVYQYIQHKMIAKDFANYLALYYKYKQDYAVEWNPSIIQKIKNAPLDEHLSIAGLLSGRLGEAFAACYRADAMVTKIYEYMLLYREHQKEWSLETVIGQITQDLEAGKKAEQLTRTEEKTMQKAEAFFETARMSHPVPKKRFMRKSKHSLKRRQRGWRNRQKRQPVCCSMCLRFWKLHLERARRWWHLLQN